MGLIKLPGINRWGFYIQRIPFGGWKWGVVRTPPHGSSSPSSPSGSSVQTLEIAGCLGRVSGNYGASFPPKSPQKAAKGNSKLPAPRVSVTNEIPEKLYRRKLISQIICQQTELIGRICRKLHPASRAEVHSSTENAVHFLLICSRAQCFLRTLCNHARENTSVFRCSKHHLPMLRLGGTFGFKTNQFGGSNAWLFFSVPWHGLADSRPRF